MKLLRMATICGIAAVISLGSAEALTQISACGPLDVPGETYLVAQDIAASGSCLTITADNVVLDGNGYSLTGDGTGVGVAVQADGVVIQNCAVLDFETSVEINGLDTSVLDCDVSSSGPGATGYGVATVRRHGISGIFIDGLVALNRAVGVLLAQNGYNAGDNLVVQNSILHGDPSDPGGVGIYLSRAQETPSFTYRNNDLRWRAYGIQHVASGGSTLIVGNDLRYATDWAIHLGVLYSPSTVEFADFPGGFDNDITGSRNGIAFGGGTVDGVDFSVYDIPETVIGVTSGNVTVTNCNLSWNGVGYSGTGLATINRHQISNILVDTVTALHRSTAVILAQNGYDAGDNLVVQNSILHGDPSDPGGVGVHLSRAQESPAFTILNNDLRWRAYGVRQLASGGSMTVTGNDVRYASNWGIWLGPFYRNATVLVSDNLASHAANGISIRYAAFADVVGNSVTSNDSVGLDLGAVSANTRVWHNNLYCNAAQVVADNALELSNAGEGNFWGRNAPPLHVCGADTNNCSVVDSFPYGYVDGWSTGKLPGEYPEGSPPFVCNNPPIADAGENIGIDTSEVQQTVLLGEASDPDPDDVLQYRWMEAGAVLRDWTAVEIDGVCPLVLDGLPLAVGTHLLTLEVTDGAATASDDMFLTIDNSAPNPAPIGGGVYEVGSEIVLGGFASDYDGDLLTYRWLESADVLGSGSIETIAGGAPVELPALIVHGFDLGQYDVALELDDGVNAPVSSFVHIEVVDTGPPTLAPEASSSILWPPNHKMVDIVINANAFDNDGFRPVLAATVESNEPVAGLGDGDASPDWSEPIVDHENGIVGLQLRAERSGSGEGRVYTVTITATDQSGNSSQAVVEIIVPHDRRNE